MTVWIYVDASRQGGDVDHLKVFASEDAAKPSSQTSVRRAWRLSMQCCPGQDTPKIPPSV
jgi:hypothetical protein